MALQEWRHWLEGTKEPFTVCTDYKNFAYTRTVKTLNSRQAVPISTSTMVPHLNGLHDWCAVLTRQVRNTYHCWPFLQVHSFYPLSKFSSVLKTASLAHLTTFSISMGSCWTKSQTGGPNLFVHSFQVHISILSATFHKSDTLGDKKKKKCTVEAAKLDIHKCFLIPHHLYNSKKIIFLWPLGCGPLLSSNQMAGKLRLFKMAAVYWLEAGWPFQLPCMDSLWNAELM